MKTACQMMWNFLLYAYLKLWQCENMLPHLSRDPGTEAIIFSVTDRSCLTYSNWGIRMNSPYEHRTAWEPAHHGNLEDSQLVLRKLHRYPVSQDRNFRANLDSWCLLHLMHLVIHLLILPHKYVLNLAFPLQFHCQCPSSRLHYLFPGTLQ